MRLSRKHQNQTSIIRADFSGGLNTSALVDGIAENQLGECLNVEADHSTGRLKTVAGTVDVMTSENEIFAAIYDEINNIILTVTADKSVYYGIVKLGTLTGDLYPIYCAWEDGVLIASGGKLQYYNGSSLTTIADSPICSSVYVRAGRVVVTDDKNARYSGVGDETNWTEDTNDDSTSKFLEVGYKDGGEVIGFVSLSQDIMFIKSNRHVYRLSNEFPNWVLNEVSRNVECSGRLSFCAVADRVFILGKNEFQALQTVEQYGAVKPANVGTNVQSELQKLPANAKVRFVPPLQQIWIIGDNGLVLMFDLVFNSWYRRVFNSNVIDVISIGDEVYVVKPYAISKLDENTFYDSNEPLQWRFVGQRLISQHDYLLKRTQVSVIPLSSELYAGQISVGAVRVPLPVPAMNMEMFGNKSPIYKNQTKIPLSERRRYVYTKGEPVMDDIMPMYGNDTPVLKRQTYIKVSKNIFRSKFLDIVGTGSTGGFLLNGIVMEIAEV